MNEALALDPTTIALVSLAANIAANHPKKGLCQIARLRGYGATDAQIDMVVDIARHLRDEAGQMLDAQFDEEAGLAIPPAPAAAACCPAPATSAATPADGMESCGCTPTAKGNACC